jgi:hypothetical protein
VNDDLADLHEQRRFLLRSIEDLDRELAAGDLDQADHAVLRADYTARAAEVLRRIEHGGAIPPEPVPGLPAGVPAGAPPDGSGAAPPRSAARPRVGLTRLVTVAAVVATAVGAGLFVARSAGERTEGALLTGGDRVTRATTAEQDAALRLLQSARDNLTTDRLAAIQDFDSAWKLDPTLVEAPTYAAWLLRLVAQGVEDTGQRALFIDGARRRLDEAVAADPNYPDARAFRGILRLRDLDDPVGADQDFTVLASLDPPEEIRQLVGSASQEASEEASQAAATAANAPAGTGPAPAGTGAP